MSAWQAWKRRNHEHETFVIAAEGTMVFQTTCADSDTEYVWYHPIDETDLPEGVEITGVAVRDTRSETDQ